MCMKDLKNFCVYDAPDVNLRNTGMILKQLRLKNNLTVRDLQEFFRFDYPNAIYDWEKGLKLPNLSNLIALSTLYEVSIDEILLSDEQDFHFREPLSLNCEIITKNIKMWYNIATKIHTAI